MSKHEAYEVEASAKVVPPTMFYWTKTVHHEGYDRISPFKPEHSANGKNVVVTGGGTGIGRSIAINFARAGAKSVLILGRREDQLIEAAEEIRSAATDSTSVIQYRVADLAQRTQVDRALELMVSNVGKLDILVSNAAAIQDFGPISSYSAKDFMWFFDSNVLTAFNAVNSFIPRAKADAMIINISTALAHFSPMAGAGAYGISKAANLKMMDYVAKENPKLHVVNVQPGTVATAMSAKAGVKPPDSADLPGYFCVWLASPGAQFLKSKFVWANWDVDELVARADEIKDSRLFTWSLEGVPM